MNSIHKYTTTAVRTQENSCKWESRRVIYNDSSEIQKAVQPERLLILILFYFEAQNSWLSRVNIQRVSDIYRSG